MGGTQVALRPTFSGPDGQKLSLHTEPWPGGRTNHYHFDLNRDRLTITQPETAGRIRALRQWYPLVFVDLHEMGTESTYYFAPEAVPYNPHLVKEQRAFLDWFGRTNAKYFDQFGFSYFTREQYDAFYPGYGASWPSYYGGIAMTYENGVRARACRPEELGRHDDHIPRHRTPPLRLVHRNLRDRSETPGGVTGELLALPRDRRGRRQSRAGSRVRPPAKRQRVGG